MVGGLRGATDDLAVYNILAGPSVAVGGVHDIKSFYCTSHPCLTPDILATWMTVYLAALTNWAMQYREVILITHVMIACYPSHT